MSSRFSLAPGHEILPVSTLFFLATMAVSLIGLIAGTGEAASLNDEAGIGGAMAMRGAAGVGHHQAPDQAFGYFVGEERRYVLGPPESLLDGEGRDWRIKLESIEGEAEDFVAIFSFEFEDRTPGISARGQQEVYFRVEGELWVNRFGFPLTLRYLEFDAQSGESPWRGDPRTTVYEYDSEAQRYRKSVRVPDQDLDYTVPVARSNAVDLGVPSGLIAYLPTGDGDSALVNPGLLSLALPTRVDAALPDTRMMLLSPQVTPRFPERDWITAERNARESLARNYAPSEIKVVEQTSIEIGRRTVPAWRLEMGRFPGKIYADDGGQVLRVDINRHPRNNKERWIRLLHPTEY